ncbi:MAG: hypothetical protein LCH38_12850 [Proteobacteria bacterium]|nr:hypothetical protein [Pseudomonadota bacterium]
MRLKSLLFLGLVLAATGVQIGLGVWQWQRLGEKRAFLAAMEKAAADEPANFERSDPAMWSRVTLTGRYLHERTSYVRTSRPEAKPGDRQAGGFGVLVMTPFITRRCDSKGERCVLVNIYVNRGFLPTPPDGRLPAFDRPEEPVTITGFLRPAEKTGLFQPAGDPARGIWFQRDTEAMALANGLPGARETGIAGYSYDRFIDREAGARETAPPHGIDAVSFLKNVPNNHFSYALTWWGLAATNIAVLVAFLFSRRKRRDEAP